MRKQLTALLLVLILCAGLLVGCADGKDPETTAPIAPGGATEPGPETTDAVTDAPTTGEAATEPSAEMTTAEPETDAPTEPSTEAPTEPSTEAPTEPSIEAPTEPKPTEPKPTEPKPTEPKPTEPKPTEPKPTEPKPTDPPPTEPKPTDPPPTEPLTPAKMRQIAESLINHPVSELYAAIGYPSDKSYASSCNGPGDDGELYYDGFTVYTYREGDKETVVDVDD